MRNTHIADHLTVAKLGAIANNDRMLAYLIDMALIHEAQQAKYPAPSIAVSKVA